MTLPPLDSLKVSDEAFFQKQSYSIDTKNCSRIAEKQDVRGGADCCLEKPFLCVCVCASLWGNLSSILLFRSS